MKGNFPTSDIETFNRQINSPNTHFQNVSQQGELMKINKNFVLSFVSDSSGCGHIRNIFPLSYLNAHFGKSKKFNLILSPMMFVQEEVLMRTRSVFFQRMMDPRSVRVVKRFSDLKKKYNYKMVYDIDDFIWRGDREGEEIPEYNFGSKNITDPIREASFEIMSMMDIVCVSTQFLKDYQIEKGIKSEIRVVPNSVAQYFWGTQVKKPIKTRIERPRVIYTGSPTHYHNNKKLKGDWNNAWYEWVCKNVTDNKIDFCVMGGLPWFFEPIKNKIRVVPWINSYQYHLPIKQFRPDFGIAPLVPNYFNYSKSDIKHIEYEAVGALSIGTTFSNGFPSPYDNNFVKVSDNVTVKELDELFDEYREPEKYNDIILKQYNHLKEEGRWQESPKYIKTLTSIF